MKVNDLWQITCYISEMVQDSHIVSIKVNRKLYEFYQIATLLVTSSDTQPHQKTPFCTVFCIFVAGVDDFKFDTGLYADHSKS